MYIHVLVIILIVVVVVVIIIIIVTHVSPCQAQGKPTRTPVTGRPIFEIWAAQPTWSSTSMLRGITTIA